MQPLSLLEGDHIIDSGYCELVDTQACQKDNRIKKSEILDHHVYVSPYQKSLYGVPLFLTPHLEFAE